MAIIYTITFIFFVLFVYTILNSIQFSKTIKILGLRVPKNWDGYEKKGEEQFRDECAKNSIRIDSSSMPNICYLIPALEMKGLHLELVKDGHEEYNNQEGNYLGSEEWIEKWRKIIFSPAITSSEFCLCIKIIMKAHRFNESNNNHLPFVKGLDGSIKEKDSYFIYRALYIMHYNIRIRKNTFLFDRCMITNDLLSRETFSREFSITNLSLDTYRVLKLSEIVDIHIGIDVCEGDISLENTHRGLVYLRNIDSGKSSVFYNSSYRVSSRNIANSGYIVMGRIPPYSISKWKEEESILTEDVVALQLSDEEVICDYLLLFLEVVIEEIKKEKIERVKLELHKIQNIKIVIPPREIQKRIIKESLPIKHDVEKMKAMLFDFNKQLVETVSENILIVQSLLKSKIEQDSSLDSSPTYYYSGYKTEWANGHYRKYGSYVKGHYRNRRK